MRASTLGLGSNLPRLLLSKERRSGPQADERWHARVAPASCRHLIRRGSPVSGMVHGDRSD